jgi:hypothetical protein
LSSSQLFPANLAARGLVAMTILGNHIVIVLFASSKPQMSRIDASTVGYVS